MAKVLDLSGQTFGRLTVINRFADDRPGPVRWRCRCSCGNETVPVAASLRSGATTSCGCRSREVTVALSTTHGQFGTPMYRRWSNIIQRTTNPGHPDYANYGGRGITVCSEWRGSFEAFSRDMSPGYSTGLELDRIDNDGSYDKDNCRWVTRTEQNRNRRNSVMLTFRGRTMNASAWAKALGLNGATVRSRLRTGWSVERALTVGVAPQRIAALMGTDDAEPIT